MTKREYERSAREAVERLDILEEELPRGACSIRGCNREARYEWAGQWRTFWICSRHRPLYRTHDRILARIRASPIRDRLPDE